MMKIPNVDIVEACHPKLLNIPLSLGQSMFLKANDGLPMNQEETDLFCVASGRDSYAPGHYVREPYLNAGRRFGKTHHVVVPAACYAAVFRKYENMRPGEHPTIMVLAVTKDQAQIAHRGIVETLRSSPFRALLPMFPRREKLSLRNGVDVIVTKCDLRSVRGYAIALCVAEEVAFWRSEDDPTQNPAEEILAAVRPALLQFEHGRLLCVSSPWSKSGPLWAAHARRLESLDPLYMRLTTTQGNPTIPVALLEAERARDPEKFEREINAEFLDAASALLPSDALDACVAKDRWENPPKPGAAYVAGIDVAFRSDWFGFALSHAEGERVIVDLVRSWKPKPGKAVQFSSTMDSIIEICKHYGCTRAFADQVANEVVKQRLAAAGIVLEQVSTLGRRASGIYSTLRAKTLAGQLELPDNPELVSQLRRLEIVRSSGGGERCEASSGHDDVAIAAALSVHQCVSAPSGEPWDTRSLLAELNQVSVTDDSDFGWRRVN
jgi:hypothetical protein